MKRSNRTFAAAMLASVMMALAAMVFTSSAQAQITVNNTSGCTVILNLNGSGGRQGPFTIPSGTTPTVIGTPAGYVPTGVEDVNGRNNPFGSSGCTGCMPLAQPGSNDFCCVIACYDSSTNTINITSCGPC
jgi:hypothetical protein